MSHECFPTDLCRSTSFQSIKVPFSDQRDGCRGDRVISAVKHPTSNDFYVLKGLETEKLKGGVG